MALSRRIKLTTYPLVVLPEGVTYLRIDPTGFGVGERPHAPSAPDGEQCRASLDIDTPWHRTPNGDGLWCTDYFGHEGQHVAMVAPGSPVAAWIDAP